MAKSVGLDIHTRGVRAVEVTGRGKSFKVTRYMERDVTPRGGAADPEELREALAEIFKSFSKNHVVTDVEASDTVVREIPIPFKSDDQIRKVIKYEAEHHLHNCDADDVVVQYTRVGETADATNLLVFAVRKDDISRRIEHARSAGVEPLKMDLDALALYRAASVAGHFEETPNAVLLNIGHRSTTLVFVGDGEVRALRSVRIGVDSIAQGLARDMDIDFFEADHKLSEMADHDDGGDLFVPVDPGAAKAETEKSHAELERDIFNQKRDEIVARLKREYVRSSAALRGAGPERIIATGPGLAVPGLIDLLGQRLGTAVESFRPSQHFKCSLGKTSPEHFDANATVALGLALKGIGNDDLGIDFRQEELKVANKFELLKGPLAITVTLLFIGILAFAFHTLMKKKQLQQERFNPMLTEAYKAFSTVTGKYNRLGEKIVPKRRQVEPIYVENDGKKPEAVKRFVNRMRRMNRHLLTFTGDEKSGLPQIKSSLTVMNDIFEVLKKEHKTLGFVDLEKLTISQTSVRIGLIVADSAAAEHIQGPLGQIAFLKDMKPDDWRVQPVRDTTPSLVRVTFQWKTTKKRR